MDENLQSSAKKPSRLWYLLPILFGLLGGIAGYLLVQDKDKKFAKRLLIVGIIITGILVFLTLILPMIIATFYSMGVFKIGGGGTGTVRSPCYPCFSSFAYIDYASGSLRIRNGPQQIRITTITATPDIAPAITSTALNVDTDVGKDVLITGIDTTGDVLVSITYTSIVSGISHIDSATMHNK